MMPARVKEHMPARVKEHMPARVKEHMQDRVKEHMPARVKGMLSMPSSYESHGSVGYITMWQGAGMRSLTKAGMNALSHSHTCMHDI
jgi:hypothetical protein